MPAARPPPEPRDEQHVIGRRPCGQKAHRDRERRADQQHRLASVPVAQGPEVQDRAGKAERVADRDQVERGLRRVESSADRRQRNVGNGQVQVGDRRDQDQRGEDDALPVGCRPGIGKGRLRLGLAHDS
jgi:hypothetical protein